MAIVPSTNRDPPVHEEDVKFPETVNHAENNHVEYHLSVVLIRHHQICGNWTDWPQDVKMVGTWLLVNSLISPELTVNEFALVVCVEE